MARLLFSDIGRTQNLDLAGSFVGVCLVGELKCQW